MPGSRPQKIWSSLSFEEQLRLVRAATGMENVGRNEDNDDDEDDCDDNDEIIDEDEEGEDGTGVERKGCIEQLKREKLGKGDTSRTSSPLRSSSLPSLVPTSPSNASVSATAAAFSSPSLPSSSLLSYAFRPDELERLMVALPNNGFRIRWVLNLELYTWKFYTKSLFSNLFIFFYRVIVLVGIRELFTTTARGARGSSM